MKKLNRFILGLASSLLLICGFARAAERCDPVSPVRAEGQRNVSGVAPTCIDFCNAAVD